MPSFVRRRDRGRCIDICVTAVHEGWPFKSGQQSTLDDGVDDPTLLTNLGAFLLGYEIHLPTHALGKVE